MTNIFIANLDWDITSDDLKVTFSAFGEVHLAHVVFDAKTRKSKGFGYVEMESAEEAIAAIQALHGFEVNERKLDVKIASPKTNRPKPEDKPKKPFSSKPSGPSYGKKPFNSNGPRPGGYNSGGSGGGYKSNDSAPRKSWDNNNSSSSTNKDEMNRKLWDSLPSSGSSASTSSSSTSSSSSSSSSSTSSEQAPGAPERKLRPRRKSE